MTRGAEEGEVLGMNTRLRSRACGRLLFHFLLFDFTLFSKRSVAWAQAGKALSRGWPAGSPPLSADFPSPAPRARTQRGEALWETGGQPNAGISGAPESPASPS